MDDRLFDRMTLTLTEHLCRRRLGRLGAGVLAALGLEAITAPHVGAKARKRRNRRDDGRAKQREADREPSRVAAEKKKKKKKKKPTTCIPQCAGKTCGRGGCANAPDDACGPCDVRAGFSCSNIAAGGDCQCPSGIQCSSGSRCCAANRVCLHDQCCDPANVCHGDQCCVGDQQCLDDGCCPEGRVCDDACCGEDETCIANECCPNADACGGTACCGDDETCVDDGCCPDADLCNADECCGPNQACLSTGCCAEARVCGAACCRNDEICDDETTTCRCPDGEKPCEGACIPEDACCDNGGLLPGADLQAAIDAAPSGGTVVLGCGTFTLLSALRIKKNVTLRGQGPEFTILDGPSQNSVTGFNRVMWIGGDPSNPVFTVRVEGVTVTGAETTNQNGGAGIYNQRSHLTLVNCVIENNRAPNHAGIACAGGNAGDGSASLTLTHCIVRANYAARPGGVGGGGVGGGVGADQNCPLTMTDCVIANNQEERSGGGISSSSPSTITRCSVSGNVADGSATRSIGYGGGLLFSQVDGEVHMIDSDITDNKALGTSTTLIKSTGGGIYVQGIDEDFGLSVLTLSNTSVRDNIASGQGGGIFRDQVFGPVVINIQDNSDVSDNCPDNCSPASICPAATVDCS